jgi:hypothetical protein
MVKDNVYISKATMEKFIKALLTSEPSKLKRKKKLDQLMGEKIIKYVCPSCYDQVGRLQKTCTYCSCDLTKHKPRKTTLTRLGSKSKPENNKKPKTDFIPWRPEE